jgi:ethanolamine utilization protein EutN
MILARVTGTVISTAKHAGYDGKKLMIVQPIDERGQNSGDELIAVDHVQAGVGDTVLILREGNGVRQVLGMTGKTLPLLELIVGIVDDVELGEGAR